MQAPEGDPATAPAAVVTPFPPPPPFFRLYARGAAAGPPPPPPPLSADAPIVVFGAEHRASEDPLAPLQVPDLLRQAGVAQTGADPRPALHLLLDAVLASALGLLDTLVDAPSDYAAGATAAIGALHNLMHGINALRPGQTRHALARALEAQVEHKREAARAVREAARAAGEELARRAEEVENAAAAAAEAGADQGGAGGGNDAMEVEAAGEGAVAKKGGAKAAGRSGGIAAAAAAAAPATG